MRQHRNVGASGVPAAGSSQRGSTAVPPGPGRGAGGGRLGSARSHAHRRSRDPPDGAPSRRRSRPRGCAVSGGSPHVPAAVRNGAARNPNCPAEILGRFYDDGDKHTRAAVPLKPSCTATVSCRPREMPAWDPDASPPTPTRGALRSRLQPGLPDKGSGPAQRRQPPGGPLRCRPQPGLSAGAATPPRDGPRP